MKIDGGCHCGFIAFEAEADPGRAGICHCTDCQALTGSAFRITVPVDPGAFSLTQGQPTLYEKVADSGATRIQAFCPRCGSSIYATSPGPDPKVYSVRLGVVRQREHFPPKVQIWARSQAPWVDHIADIPRLEAGTLK